MPITCPQCNSKNYLQKGKKLCVKCRALQLEHKYIENKEKAPRIAAGILFNHYCLEGKTLREIAEDLKITSPVVKYWLIKYEIPLKSLRESKKNKFDSKFFKRLTSKSAYLLGYFFSDGDLLINRNTGKYYLRIYCKHRENIEKVRRLLKTNAKIQYRKEVINEREKKGALYFIHIADQEIVKDLMELGMVYDKNQSAKYPPIPENLNRHFIRGLWTGSGTVYLEKGYMLRSKIVIGSIYLITEVEKILHSQGLSKRNLHKSSTSKKPSYSFRYNTIEDQKKLFKYLYKGSEIDTIEERQYHQYKSYFIMKRKTINTSTKTSLKNP